MLAVLARFAPHLVLLVGWPVGFLVFRSGTLAEHETTAVLEYNTRLMLGIFILATSSAIAAAICASRSEKATDGRRAALLLVGSWVLIGSALSIDLVYAVTIGVDPLPDTCTGGMDCIGEPHPAAPLTRDGQWLVCYLWLSTPFVALCAMNSLVSHRGRVPNG